MLLLYCCSVSSLDKISNSHCVKAWCVLDGSDTRARAQTNTATHSGQVCVADPEPTHLRVPGPVVPLGHVRSASRLEQVQGHASSLLHDGRVVKVPLDQCECPACKCEETNVTKWCQAVVPSHGANP